MKDCARRFVLLKLTTDIHEASRGPFATAELLVSPIRLDTISRFRTDEPSQAVDCTAHATLPRHLLVDDMQGYCINLLATIVRWLQELTDVLPIAATGALLSTWTSMCLAPVCCRVRLHSLLPTDDACSSSSLSTTVIKFSIFSDPTRQFSAYPPELRRIR